MLESPEIVAPFHFKIPILQTVARVRLGAACEETVFFEMCCAGEDTGENGQKLVEKTKWVKRRKDSDVVGCSSSGSCRVCV